MKGPAQEWQRRAWFAQEHLQRGPWTLRDVETVTFDWVVQTSCHVEEDHLEREGMVLPDSFGESFGGSSEESFGEPSGGASEVPSGVPFVVVEPSEVPFGVTSGESFEACFC